MDYKKIYDNLILRAKRRKLVDVYTEEHHIIPKCLNGSNKKENKVKLLAREHFIVHLLLTKVYPNNPKLWYALNMLCKSNKYQIRNNKMYEWIKIKYSKYNSVIQKERLKNKTNHPMYNKHHTEEAKRKNSESQKGKTLEERIGKERAQLVKQKIRGFRIPRETRFCECGCNKTFICKENSKLRFILGHRSKIQCENVSKLLKNKAKPWFKNIPKTIEHRKKIGKSLKNRKYINKNTINKSIKIELLQNYLDNGWKLGRYVKCQIV